MIEPLVAVELFGIEEMKPELLAAPSARAVAIPRRAGSERVGRSDGPGSDPGSRGPPGRAVGDVQCTINFAPPFAGACLPLPLLAGIPLKSVNP